MTLWLTLIIPDEHTAQGALKRRLSITVSQSVKGTSTVNIWCETLLIAKASDQVIFWEDNFWYRTDIKITSDQDNFLRKNYLCSEIQISYAYFRNSIFQNKVKHILILTKSHSGHKSILRFFIMNLNLSSARGFVKISAHWWSVSINCNDKIPFWT